jgi:hypothetical protein
MVTSTSGRDAAVRLQACNYRRGQLVADDDAMAVLAIAHERRHLDSRGIEGS